MTLVVSGASGFVGQALMRHCGQRARPLSLRTDPLDWGAVLHGAHCVVHLAARVHVMRESHDDALAQYRAVNTALTLAVAQRAAHAGVRRFVFVSSVKVNGESSLPGHPLNESMAAAPQDPYGISKWEAEQALHALGRQCGMEIVVVRTPLVYGPGVRANFASLIRLVRSGIPLPLASVRNVRSMVALDNLVDFLDCCATHPAAPGHTFFVSDGDDVSTPELICRIGAAMQRPARLVPFPVAWLRRLGALAGRSDAVERLCGNLQVNISSARSVLHWSAPVSMQDCLLRTVSSTLS